MADPARAARWVLVCGLAWLTWQFARVPADPAVIDSFLHLPNLVFHEAGHVLFLPFGQFITVLGGSLLQVIVPCVCAAAFLWQYEDRFAAAVCGWWAGQSLVDLAPYIADARALRIPLIGGRTGAEVEGHDWEYLLTALGWLHRDVTLGRTAHMLGTLVMLAALAWAVSSLMRASGEPGRA